MGILDAKESLISLVTAAAKLEEKKKKIKCNADTELRIRILNILC